MVILLKSKKESKPTSWFSGETTLCTVYMTVKLNKKMPIDSLTWKLKRNNMLLITYSDNQKTVLQEDDMKAILKSI